LGTYNYASLWVAMSVAFRHTCWRLLDCRRHELVAGGADDSSGNLIVLIPMLLNAHAGTRYGIPFPVLARASFGVRGANVPAVLRRCGACGWFGIQAWIAGRRFFQC